MRADYAGRGSRFTVDSSRLLLRVNRRLLKINASLTGVNWNALGLTCTCGHHSHICALEEARNRDYLKPFLVILPV